MPFLADFEYDVFVSYSLANDQYKLDGEPWVTKFVDELKIKLANSLSEGGKEVSVYFAGTGSIRPGEQLSSCRVAAQKSALFLIIGSPRYLDYWPASELEAFTDGHRAQDRIYLSHMLPLPKGKFYPDALGQPFYLDFYGKTRFGNAKPFEEVKGECNGALTDLAAAMAQKLMEMRDSAAAATTRQPNPDYRTVLVTVTADLGKQVKALRAHLRQYDIPMVPASDGDFQEEGEAFRAEYLAALDQASIVVQLLGPEPTRRTKAFPEGLETFQLEAARAKPGCEIRQWRDPCLTPAAVDDEQHRDLVFSSSVDAEPFEEFKKSVRKLAMAPPTQPAPEAGRSYLFIDAAGIDEGTARRVFAQCQRLQIPAVTPTYGVEKPRNYRTYYEKADRIAVIHEKSEPSWLNSQLYLFIRTMARRGVRADKRAIVFLGPPPPKSKETFTVYHPNIDFVEAPNGNLDDFFARLF